MSNLCMCKCHSKANNSIMHAFEIPCNCCSLYDVRYINDDGSIDEDKLANTKVNRWNEYRKRNFIEWFRSKGYK